jgi:hypothetical protein
MFKELSEEEQMVRFLKRNFFGKLMECDGFKIRVDDVTYFDGNYRINARGGNNFCITYYNVVDESKNLYLIRNSAKYGKSPCYWNGIDDWVDAKDAAMYFEDVANLVCENLCLTKPCVVVVSEHSAEK